MRTSLKPTVRIHKKESQKIMHHKYSSSQQKPKNTDVRIRNMSKDFLQGIYRMSKKHPHANNNIKQPQVYSSQDRFKRNNQSPLLEGIHSKNVKVKKGLSRHSSRGNIFRTPEEQKKFEIKDRKAVRERINTQQKEVILQQIQFKKDERIREKKVVSSRYSHDRFFILKSHKQTIDMLKKSRKVSARSELKIIKDQYQQTEREHDFLVKNKKKVREQRQNQIKYKRTFLTGNVPRTLKEKDKKRIEFLNQVKEIQQGLPKVIASKINIGFSKPIKKIPDKNELTHKKQNHQQPKESSKQVQTFLTSLIPNPEDDKKIKEENIDPEQSNQKPKDIEQKVSQQDQEKSNKAIEQKQNKSQGKEQILSNREKEQPQNKHNEQTPIVVESISNNPAVLPESQIQTN